MKVLRQGALYENGGGFRGGKWLLGKSRHALVPG